MIIILLLLLSSCSKSKGNGAKNYSSEFYDVSHNYYISKEIPFPDSIDKIDSVISYEMKDYCFDVNNIPKSSIQITELLNKNKKNITLSFDYKYIKDCTVINEDIFILYVDNSYNTYIANINENGKIKHQNICGSYGESIIWTGNFLGIWYYDTQSTNSSFLNDVILEKYDLSLKLVETVNISTKLNLENNAVISRIISDFSGNTWAEINYNIKENNIEQTLTYDTKIIKFNCDDYSIIYSIDNINALTGIKDIYVSDELMITYRENDITYINQYSKTDGAIIDFYEIEKAEYVFPYYSEYVFSYLYEDYVFGVDETGNEIKVDEINGKIINNHITDKYSIITCVEFVQNLELLVFDYNGKNTESISFILPENEIITNVFSVSDKYLLFAVEDNLSNKKRLLTFDRNTHKKTYYNIEVSGEITDVEIICDTDVYIVLSENSQSRIVRYNLLNKKITDIYFQDSIEYDNIILSATSDGNILFILNKEKTYYIFETTPDNNIAVFESDCHYWNVSFIKGYGIQKFFINTTDKIYAYTDCIKKIADVCEFSSDCSIDTIRPAGSDKYMVYGIDYYSGIYKLYIMEKKNITNKKIIKVYISPDVEKYVNSHILKFNNENEDVFVETIKQNNLHTQSPDVIIYDNNFDIYSYLNHNIVYNLKNVAEKSGCFSFAFDSIGESDFLYKFIPAFSVYEYEETENNYATKDEIIEKIIMFDAEQYIDFENKICNFTTNDFIKKIEILKKKNNILISDYQSINDIINQKSMVTFNENAVIVPEFNISVITNENTENSLVFLNTFYDDEYQIMYLNNFFKGFSVKESLYQILIEEKELYNMQPEMFKSLFESVKNIYHFNNKIYTIVYNELLEYSSGSQTCEETVRNIENKIDIYFKELD